MEKKHCGCPWSTTGATLDISGCRFTLSIMSDDYIDIILGALKKVDTSKVWSETDALSSIYRGKREHIFDALSACFIHSYKENIHAVCDMTFSKGCPGDSDGDSIMNVDDTLMNYESYKDIHFEAMSKISLYPLGKSEYMQEIIDVVNMAKDYGIYVKSAHYVTILKGDIQTILKFYQEALKLVDKTCSHYVLQATLSVNSPTKG